MKVKADKVIMTAGISAFFGMILLSALTSDIKGGKVSETQKRKLATFPDITAEDMTPGKFTQGMEDWCSDNIGFADLYNRFYTAVNVRLLGKMTNSQVQAGKDGFYFITESHNTEIGMGLYKLSEDTLKEIAHEQQKVADYYKRNGIEYYLVLVPSKASVYPEKISGGDFAVSPTVVDQIEEYLTANTDVRVINVKDVLTEGKASAPMFIRTDTHWTAQGSYLVYEKVMERLLADGCIDAVSDFEPDMSVTAEIEGDLSGMIGVGALEKEVVSAPVWDTSVAEDTQSGEYKALEAVLDRLQKEAPMEIARQEKMWHNDSAVNDKKLLIYGDSLYRDLPERPVSRYFAENFRDTDYLRVRAGAEELDRCEKPDIVLFSCYERFAEKVLTTRPLVSDDAEELKKRSELPQQTADIWIADNGLCLNNDGGVVKCEKGSIVLDPDEDVYAFRGWAIDYRNRSDLDGMIVMADGVQISCPYGRKAGDITEHFNEEGYRDCRFKFTVDKNFITDNDVKKLTFYLLSSDGVSYYAPIEYDVSFGKQ